MKILKRDFERGGIEGSPEELLPSEEDLQTYFEGVFSMFHTVFCLIFV
jgi:hypothetical protein